MDCLSSALGSALGSEVRLAPRLTCRLGSRLARSRRHRRQLRGPPMLRPASHAADAGRGQLPHRGGARGGMGATASATRCGGAAAAVWELGAQRLGAWGRRRSRRQGPCPMRHRERRQHRPWLLAETAASRRAAHMGRRRRRPMLRVGQTAGQTAAARLPPTGLRSPPVVPFAWRRRLGGRHWSRRAETRAETRDKKQKSSGPKGFSTPSCRAQVGPPELEGEGGLLPLLTQHYGAQRVRVTCPLDPLGAALPPASTQSIGDARICTAPGL